MKSSLKYQQRFVTALKLGIGTILAISLAYILEIRHPYSTGSVALITLLASKWDTVRLTIYRVLTFFVTVFVTFCIFALIKNPVVSFGVSVMILYWFCKTFNLISTLAVNGVICAHFLEDNDFTLGAIENELMIVLIGVIAALVINQFYTTKMSEKALIQQTSQAEEKLKSILEAIAYNLVHTDQKALDLSSYEKQLNSALSLAKDFEANTFRAHTDYYSAYFRMRLSQLIVLKNLSWELGHMKMHPSQANIIVEYIQYLEKYVFASHEPIAQKQELNHILEYMKTQPMPTTRKEFESRAILFHILMDLDDFVQCKQRFIDELTPIQKQAYFNEKKS